MSLRSVLAVVIVAILGALIGGMTTMSKHPDAPVVAEVGAQQSTLGAVIDHLQASVSGPVARVTQPAMAPPPNTDAIFASWTGWADAHGVTLGTVAVGYDGQILATYSGGRNPHTPYPMASLSKAVTAVCLDQILPLTGATWDTTLGELAHLLDAIGPEPNNRIASVNLAQLANHTSGLPRVPPAAMTPAGFTSHYTQARMAVAALTDPALGGVRGGYHYSNLGYAVLGHVIEALTGQPYGDYCKTAVLKPAGVLDAAVAGRMWATKGFGGWQMSVTDYTRFAMQSLVPDADLQRAPLDPQTGYGLGVQLTGTPDSALSTHSGKWDFTDPSRQNGSMFIVNADGTAIVGSWQASLHDEAYHALFEALATHLR